jgi:hypothetical protein
MRVRQPATLGAQAFKNGANARVRLKVAGTLSHPGHPTEAFVGEAILQRQCPESRALVRSADAKARVRCAALGSNNRDRLPLFRRLSLRRTPAGVTVLLRHLAGASALYAADAPLKRTLGFHRLALLLPALALLTLMSLPRLALSAAVDGGSRPKRLEGSAYPSPSFERCLTRHWTHTINM